MRGRCLRAAGSAADFAVGAARKAAAPLLVTASLLGAAGFTGCEFGTLPIIIDGTVATAEFPVDAEVPFYLSPSFTVEDWVDVGEVYTDFDEVDSIRFYNLTFIAEGDSADLEVTVTGQITVDGAPFLRFEDVPLSVFSPGRSIFSPTAGFSYDDRGIARVREALSPGASDRVLHMRGTFQAGSRSLHFTLQAKLYTQVFLRALG